MKKNKQKNNISKKNLFTIVFICIVVILYIFKPLGETPQKDSRDLAMEQKEGRMLSLLDSINKRNVHPVKFYNPDSSLVHHQIYSVPSYKDAFPDENDIQHQVAERYGIAEVQNRDDAEKSRDSLVFVGSSPYYDIDKLKSSIPYLVPRAAVLLQDISQAFFDSLLIKGIPLHKLIISSVLRSREDVTKLRMHNANASNQSCHMFGTTVDICYNRYNPVDETRKTRNDTLKWILSEVLDDMRKDGRCYVKYEVHQGCFHLTTR